MDTTSASRDEEDVYLGGVSSLWCKERCSWLYLCRMNTKEVVGTFHMCLQHGIMDKPSKSLFQKAGEYQWKLSHIWECSSKGSYELAFPIGVGCWELINDLFLSVLPWKGDQVLAIRMHSSWWTFLVGMLLLQINKWKPQGKEIKRLLLLKGYLSSPGNEFYLLAFTGTAALV